MRQVQPETLPKKTTEKFGFLAADDYNEWECAVAND